MELVEAITSIAIGNGSCELYKTRGRGGLTHHLHSEAPAGNRRMAMTFAKLRLIVFLWCIGLEWMPL